ncbi:hypothetical protein JYK00_02555 [Thermosipho ferrireducens]|uniref:Uncharacterized protein n=1 Tax=Thermosipho ferrireducens TaxID=2571116 RepID=A0ABX7S750_9BACT|nr:hypothetical protein [Thermosipho ferrireducens]QTA38424.1 hypothetical protein JYK00_02555 [Thermosipho ferrireducens]
MTLLVPIDFKENKKVLLKVAKKESEVFLLEIIDEQIVELAAEIAVEKGWLGDKTIEEIANFLKKQYEQMADKFVNDAEKFLKEKGINVRSKKVKGKFINVLDDIKGDKYIFVYKRGYNPYWQILKPVIYTWCKDKKCEIKGG